MVGTWEYLTPEIEKYVRDEISNKAHELYQQAAAGGDPRAQARQVVAELNKNLGTVQNYQNRWDLPARFDLTPVGGAR